MMFCGNCGKELTGAQEMCLNCGAKPTAGSGFCPSCGRPTTPLTQVCPNCGMQMAKATKGKTWRTTAAGILAIVAGAVGVIELVLVAVVEIHALGWLGIGALFGDVGGILTALLAIVIPIKIVAILGGVFALKRKRWGLALAGSICAMFSSVLILLNVPLGIAAIVLVVLGRGEFEHTPRLRKSCESGLKEL